MIIGTLRSQLVYAAKERGLSDASLEEVLTKVGLANMVKRVGGLHATLDWSNVLATGEQQRLSFARLLLAGADYAFLDEATTALDAESESELYEILKSTLKTYISVGHQRSLLPHHDRVLELKGDGLWTLR